MGRRIGIGNVAGSGGVGGCNCDVGETGLGSRPLLGQWDSGTVEEVEMQLVTSRLTRRVNIRYSYSARINF